MIARQSGVDEFINKPIQRTKLLDTIRELINRAPDKSATGSTNGTHLSPPPVLRPRGARISRPARLDLPSRAVLDIKALEQLYVDAGDEGASCGIELFINETETRLVKIDNALSEDDLATVRDEVHVLKSTSGTFGLRQLSELCEITQNFFEDDDINEDRILATSQQVVQLAPKALKALNLYRRSREWARTGA